MKPHALWSHSLPERVAMLQGGTTRVAYLAPKPEYGTFRYRCFNAVDALNSHSSKFSASFFFYSDLDVVENLADHADILVVSRCPHDGPLDRVYRRFRNKGKAVLFDIDDLVFDTRFATLVASNLGYVLEEEELNQWTAFISNVGTALRASDGVITSTKYLGGLIQDFTNNPVYVSSNTFNSAQRDVSEKVRRIEQSSPGLRLGYFSGSHSHSLDFAIIKSQLAAFLRESPSSTLTIAGHLALPPEFSEFGERITTLPFMDFLDIQKALAAIDLNLVPLQDGPFTWSKSELKYFEAALVRTPTLASATPVFREAITQGRNGYLATSTEWLSTLRTIASRGHEELASVGAQAQHHAVTAYSPESLALRLEKILNKHN